ncbi:MAG: 50S ribosomal protein L13 [Planctomycetes bacterium]|nr:50S ribosomal protein L13 [Planctomycetota bacterium]
MIAPQTTFLKPADTRHGGKCQPKWYVVDGTGMVVGQLATKIATILMGKHKPEYTPHIDTGDYVIVVNADKVRFTGRALKHDRNENYTKKMAQKTYTWYTGFPGGQRHVGAIEIWEKNPTEILKLAVKRMMPKNALARHMLDKLKLFVGPDHPHQAQKPVPLPDYLTPSKS